MSHSTNQIQQILQSQVKNLAPPTRSIVVAKDTDLIVDAFKLLIENNINSVPVQNTENGEHHYFIDLSDILAHAIDILTENEIKEGFDPDISQREFARYRVGQLAGYSPTNKFVQVSETLSLKESIRTLLLYGVHRLVVTDENGKLSSILTQSQVIKVLEPYFRNFEFFSKKVGDLKLGYRATATVSINDTTKEAFKKLHAGRFSGLAIVEHDDNLVGNISVSDLSLINSDGSMFKRLMEPLSKFLETKSTKKTSPKEVLSVCPDDTVQTALDKILKSGVHRLYVVLNSKLLGVIVLSDIFELIGNDPAFLS